jgi:hypothetical protein
LRLALVLPFISNIRPHLRQPSSSFLNPAQVLRTLLQDTDSKAVELVEQRFHSRLVEKTHVCGDGSADHISKTFVLFWRCVESIVSCSCKLLVVPVLSSRAEEFLACKLLKTDNVVLVPDLIHLGVKKELGGVALCRWKCERGVRAALHADKVNAIPTALVAANVMMAYVRLFTSYLTTLTRVRELVTITGVPVAGVGDFADFVHAFVVRQLLVVFTFVQVLNQKLDDSGFIFREVNLAFVGLLFIRQN